MAKATRTGEGPQGEDISRLLEEQLRLQREISEEMGDQESLAEKMEKKLQKLSLEYGRMSARLENLSNGYVSISQAQSRLRDEEMNHHKTSLAANRRAIDNEKLILEEKRKSIVLSNQIAEQERQRAEQEQTSNQEILRIESEISKTRIQIGIRDQSLRNAKSKESIKGLGEEKTELAKAESLLLQQLETKKKAAEISQTSLQTRILNLENERDTYDQSVKNLQAQIRYDIASLAAAEEKIKIANEGIEIEQEVSRQRGLSQKVAEKIANSLGIGAQFQERVTIATRKVIESKKNVVSLEKELKENQKRQLEVTNALNNSTGQTRDLYEEELKSLEKQNEAIQKSIVYNGRVAAKTKPIMGAFKSIAGDTWQSFKGLSLAAKVAGAFGLALAGVTYVGNKLGEGLSMVSSKMGGLSEDSSNFVGGLTSGISGMLKSIPIVGGFMSGLVDIASSFLDLIIGVDDYVVRTGRQLGLTADKARTMKDSFANMAYSSEKTYVNTKALVESFASLAKQTGLNNAYTQEMLETNIELTKYAGLQTETTAELANVARITGGTMKGITKDVLAQTVALEQTTGIAFNYQQVLTEATGLSGRLGLSFAKYPKELTKSLLVVKAMGLDLKELNSMASSFLDFENSISKEFEAQLLTGKDINLAKARELFMTNDLAGAAAEITRQVGDSNSFLKMNRFQQDALAESMGMSADQMADMLKKQELFAKFGVTNQKGLLKQIDLMRSQNKEAEIRAKFQDEEAYQSMVNLSLQDKLMTSFEKVKQGLVDFLTQKNVIDRIEGFVKFLSDPKEIQNIVDTVKGYVVKIMDFVGGSIALILESVGNIANFFTFGEKGNRIERQFDAYAAKVRDFSFQFRKNLETPGVSASVVEQEKKEAVEKNTEDERIQRAVPVKDAVVFPGNKLVVNKDPLDYTIFTKDPSALQPPIERANELGAIKSVSLRMDDLQPYVQQIVSAIKDQKIITETSVKIDDIRPTFQQLTSDIKALSEKQINVDLSVLQPYLQQMIAANKDNSNKEVSIRIDDVPFPTDRIVEAIKRLEERPIVANYDKIEDLVKNIQNSVETRRETAVNIDLSGIESLLRNAIEKVSNVSVPPVTFKFEDVSSAINRMATSVNDFSNTVKSYADRPKTDAETRVSVRLDREDERQPVQYVSQKVEPSLISDIVNSTVKSVTVNAQVSSEDVKKIVSEVVSGMSKDRPIVIHTHANLNLDGQVAATTTVRSMKNNPIIGFDRQSGPMSLNS